MHTIKEKCSSISIFKIQKLKSYNATTAPVFLLWNSCFVFPMPVNISQQTIWLLLRYGNNYFCKPSHFQLKRVIWAPILTSSFRKRYHKIWNCRDRHLLMVQTSLVSQFIHKWLHTFRIQYWQHLKMHTTIEDPLPKYLWHMKEEMDTAHASTRLGQTERSSRLTVLADNARQQTPFWHSYHVWPCRKAHLPPERTTITPLSFFFPERQLTTITNNC